MSGVVSPAPISVVWVPAAAHNPGFCESQWRSGLDLFNTGSATANAEIKFLEPTTAAMQR